MNIASSVDLDCETNPPKCVLKEPRCGALKITRKQAPALPSRDCRRVLARVSFRVLMPLLAIFALLPLPVCSQAGDKARAESAEEMWTSRIEPLLDRQCLKCHAGVRQQGGLDLRSLDTMLRGGGRGPAILPGKPAESRLVQFIAPNSDTHMPPDPKKQVSDADVSLLKTWIALLPAPKSKPASGASTDTAWVPEYLAEYKRSRQTRETPPPKITLSAAIDWLLQADWKRDKIEPARVCDDAAFARRVYLDIAGRIPFKEEWKQFLADPRSDKRSRLTATLLASDDYPRHMREVFDTVLMGRASENLARERAASGWNAFLEDAFRTNRSWNETVRDMLVARPAGGTGRGAIQFLAERRNSYQAIAEAVAPVVFGVQIKCAQCHNHPLAWEIEQRHYWGLVAAFNRSKNVETETGPGVAESAVGGFINFANLKKESQPAALVFLNGKSVAERIPGADEKEADSPDLYLTPPAKDGQKPRAPAVPKFSRRESFADAVTRDNPLLARAFVNRMWANLMGRGIVHPADQIDSRHRPSHPELLEWLTRDFEQSGYDVKRLVQSMVLSRAYQLDSRPSGKTPPRPESFARALEKPLSAEQLLHSLCVATGSNVVSPETAANTAAANNATITGKTPENNRAAANAAPGKTPLQAKKANPAMEVECAFAAAFPDVMPDTYSPSLQQALFLSNSPLLDDLLKPAPGSVTAALLALKSNAARIREAFGAVLGRAPDTAELQQCQSLLASQAPEKGVKNLLWALLTCAEFQVNH